MRSNSNFVIENGVLKEYTGSGGDVVIPEGVTKIGRAAFQGCTSLTSVTIPAGVKEINKSAFQGCTNLTGVTIPAGVKRIGEHAFENCTNLTGVIIPKGVTKISKSAFQGCAGLTSVTIPAGVKEIGGWAFYGCTGLQNVTILESVKTIHEAAFYGCTGLQTVVIPEGVECISYRPDYFGSYCGAFGACTALRSVTLPHTLKTIDAYAFRGCAALERIVIPEHVEWVKTHAFSDCENLKEIVVQSEQTYFEYTEGYTISVDAINQLAGRLVLENGSPAKQGKELRDAMLQQFAKRYVAGAEMSPIHRQICLKYIKAQHKRLYSEACKNRELLQVMLDENMIKLEELEGLLADKATTPEVKAALLEYQNRTFAPGAAEDVARKKMERELKKEIKILETGVLPISELKKIWRYEKTEEGVRILGYKGMETEVIVPDKIGKDAVVEIGDYAFSNFSHGRMRAKCVNSHLITAVQLPAGVRKLGWGVFCNCVKLTRVNIPEGVTEIGGGAFYNCASLPSVTLPESLKELGEKNTFYGCNKLTEVTIPSNIQKIGYYSFAECTSLTRVTLPEHLTAIDAWTFRNCRSLRRVAIPAKVEKVAWGTFSGCTALEGFDIAPENKALTADGTVLYSKDKTTLICAPTATGCFAVPEGVTKIAGYAFSHAGLTDVTLPDSLKEIEQSAFYQCTGLTGITISDSVTEIGGGVFYGCTSLKSITIPAGVTEISGQAFSNCTGLQNVTIPASVTIISSYAFQGCKKVTIHAPAGSYAEEFAKKNDIRFIAE